MGNTGQASSFSLTRILFVQAIRKLRRRDDSKTRLRHRWHTWTSVCHDSTRRASAIYQSKTCRRTSLGSTSIVTWPTPHLSMVVARCRSEIHGPYLANTIVNPLGTDL